MAVKTLIDLIDKEKINNRGMVLKSSIIERDSVRNLKEELL